MFVILSVLFAILCLVLCVFVWKIFDNKPQLIISDEGIYAVGVGEIAWSNVEQAFVDSDGDRDYIRLSLTNYKEYLQKNERAAIPSLDPASGLETINIDLGGLDLDADTAERAILDLIKSGKLEVS